MCLLLAACGHDRGLALDLVVDGTDCQVDSYTVEIVTMPAAYLPGGGNQTTLTLPAHELVVLLPEATTHADVKVTAWANGERVGVGSDSVDLQGPGTVQRNIAVQFACNSDGGTVPDAAPKADLELPFDLAGVDLIDAHLVFGVAVQGSFDDNLYEAEGSTAPAGAGVALLVAGIGLCDFTVTASNGVTVAGLACSSDGHQLGGSVHLPVDPAHGAGQGAQTVKLTFTASNGDTASGSFSYVPLDELTSAAMSLTTDGSPRRFSTVNLPSGSTLTLPGPKGPAFLLVTGALTADSILAQTSAGGSPGCSGACNAANGPGAPPSGNGGGGYGTAAGGPAYGDPSLIGLPGGSGGGSGSVGGGAGGASVRILAGSVNLTGSIDADGDPGLSAALLGLGSTGGGGGSGGSFLLQSRGKLILGQAHADGGGGGAGPALGAGGGNGAPGRIRADTGQPGAIGGTKSPAVGYLGAMISSDFPTAQKLAAPLGSVEVVCGSATAVEIWVDGAKAGSGACDNVTNPGRKTISLSAPIANDGASIHLVCARSLATKGSPTPAYKSLGQSYQEDFNCRSLVVVK